MNPYPIVFSLLVLAGSALGAGLRPQDLRCESLREPLGVDQPQPRLSWVLEPSSASARGLSQQACQILVASSRSLLDASEGDLWDSRKVVTDQSTRIPYGGKPLASHLECYWKVRVWDQDGKVSPWSDPARWTMGLLSPADWNARWIGTNQPVASNVLAGAKWIWFPEGSPEKAAPVGTRYFRRTFALPAERKLAQARFLGTADNDYTVYVNGQEAGKGADFKIASVLDISKLLHPGTNVVAAAVRNVGEGPNPAGLVGLVRLEFDKGEPLVTPTDASWIGSDKESAGWEKTEFDASSWKPAAVLGPVGIEPWKEVRLPTDRQLPARYLRREFPVEQDVTRATVYVCGLGLSEVYVNGRRVGDHVLSPALSEYSKRVYYVTHEVTTMLRRGANAIGVILGNGRYFPPRDLDPAAASQCGFPKLLLLLRVEFADGTVKSYGSDASWKLSSDGPIRANNEYDGEDYDARMEMRGWSTAGFDDRKWPDASIVPGPAGQVVAQMIEPIRVTDTLKPVALSEPKPGVFIFDMGQNMVGWCRLRVSGSAGTTVSLRHAETLKPDGTLYLDNIRGAKVTDRYTLRGRGIETYEPRFTYHGFRYVEVTGFPGQPTLASLDGCVVNDDLEAAGNFTCSHPTINRILRNIEWGVRGNYRSIPTDCPQRDERQGWLGDRAAESRGETYLFRNGLLYAKWVQDMADAQRTNGSVSDVCPAYWPLFTDNVTWPSAFIIIPGALLDQFGDKSPIARHYPAMARWIEHMSGYVTNDIMPQDTYGDWCVPPEDPALIHSKDAARKTAGPVLGTTYFYHCLMLMNRYATLLGLPDDAQRFKAQAEKLKAGLNAKFLNREAGYYDNGAQTTSVLPLAFDMVPDDRKEQVFAHLVEKIAKETKGHIGTGLVGGQWLNRVLTDHDRADLSFGFATNTTYPSWGYMVKKGATTVWELWNGDTADPAMNSGNHVMLVGDLVIWLFEDVAGLRPDPQNPGFKHIVMRPVPVGDLKEVRATHNSPYGQVVSRWDRKENRFKWETVVPANTTATVFVPTTEPAAVTESGSPAAKAKGVAFVRAEKGYAVYRVGSGHYRWRSQLPK